MLKPKNHRFAVWITLLTTFATLGCLMPQRRPTSTPQESSISAPTTQQIHASAARTGRSSMTVPFVWFSGQGEHAKGGSSPMTIRVEPNESGQVAVGVIEELSGGAGSMWRASAWIAAFSATQALGKRLGDYEFIIKSSAIVDGPSASMLMTVSMMALMRGESLLPGSTMTGTINPDGTCGPVGGIVQKMEGAKAAGLKRFAYPVGLRHHKDQRTGKLVDLEAHARSLGLQVREVNDLFDAYTFLTGVELPRHTPATERQMEPSVEHIARMKQRNELMYKELGTLGKGLLAELKAQPAQVSDRLYKSFVQYGLNHLEYAKGWAKRGEQQASYYHLALSLFNFEVVAKQLPLWRYLISGDMAHIDDYWRQISKANHATIELDKTISATSQTRTLGGWINTTHAVTTSISSYSFAAAGAQHHNNIKKSLMLLDQLPAEQQRPELVQLLIPASIFYSGAQATAYAGRLTLNMGSEQGRVAPSIAQLKSMTDAYRSASVANMAYLDSLTVEPMAKQEGISLSLGQERFAQRELGYALARRSTLLATSAPTKTERELMLAIAAAANGYMRSSSLIYKYYSLQAQRDAKGQLVVAHRKAPTTHLDLARARSKEAAGRILATQGFIPEAAKAEYSLAMALRDGSDEDKLVALESFWLATFWSELALAISP